MSTTEFSIVCSIRCPTVIRVHVEKKIKCFHFFFFNIEIFRQKTGNSKRTCVGFYSGNKTGPTSVVIPVFFAYLTVETWRRPCLDLQKKKKAAHSLKRQPEREAQRRKKNAVQREQLNGVREERRSGERRRETQTHGAATDPQTDATSRQVNYAAVGIRSHSLRRVRRVRTTRNFHPPNLANFYARTSGVKTLW